MSARPTARGEGPHTPGWEPRRLMLWSGLGAWYPALVSLAVASSAAAIGMGAPTTLTGVLCLVATAPIARTLASRVMLWAIGGLAAAGLLTLLPSIPIDGRTAGVLLAVGAACAVAVGHVTGPHHWRPQVRSADWLAVTGAGLLLISLTIPLGRMGPEDVLLDLARSFDNTAHFSMFRNIESTGSTRWVPSDGTLTVWPDDYPKGFHVLVALLSLIASTSEGSPRLTDFAVLSAIAVAASGAIMGFIATEVARSAGPRTSGETRAVWAGLVVLVVLPFGGLFTGLFELGHAAFLYPASVGVAASWLALARLDRPVVGWLILALAAAGIACSYPPLLSGIVPAGLVLVAAHVKRAPRTLIGGASLLILVVVGSQLWRWRSTLEVVATATGEHSTPVATCVITTLLTGIAVAAAASRRRAGRSVAALAPAAGFSAAAFSIGMLAARAASPILENYYVAKLLQAAWVAELPVLIGLSTALLHERVVERGLRGQRLLMLAGTAAITLLLCFLPDGRYRGEVPGLALLSHRTLERDRALGQVRLVQASQLLGPAGRDAAVAVAPSGWFYRFADESPSASQWVRNGAWASLWLNAMRGVVSDRQVQASLCMGQKADEAAVPCLRLWLSDHPVSELTIVLPEGTDPRRDESFLEIARDFPDRVKTLRLPADPSAADREPT